jgi:protein-disulfide isomerase
VRKVSILILALAVSAFAQSAAKKTAAPANATAAQSASKPGNLPSEETVTEFLRHTFGYDQNLKYRVLEIKPSPDPSLSEVSVVMSTPEGPQQLKLFVTPNQRFAISGEFVPFGADPYAATRQTLQQRMNGPSRGPASAPLTIVEFGDLQCPACKRAQPTIEKLLADVPNARLVMQQFPLVQLHKWAMLAAKYGLCVARQNNDAYWKFVDTVYEHQDELQPQTEQQVAPKLKEFATEAGVNADQAEQCTNDPAIAVKINDSMILGRDVDVTATPTLFIGGRKIGNVSGIPYETLKAIAEFQAANSK